MNQPLPSFALSSASWILGISGLLFGVGGAAGQVLDSQKLLDAQKFWDNRDWDWYQKNIPFFECPDADINTTYYYRWELLTKHLTYGSPNSGYSFTEFIDRPFWSGAYGAISCPAGHQLYEARWLRDSRYVRDYARYWFRTPGAQPRNYSTWLADAVWINVAESSYWRRPRWIGWLLHGFLFFMVFNAMVPYGTWIGRSVFAAFVVVGFLYFRFASRLPDSRPIR